MVFLTLCEKMQYFIVASQHQNKGSECDVRSVPGTVLRMFHGLFMLASPHSSEEMERHPAPSSQMLNKSKTASRFSENLQLRQRINQFASNVDSIYYDHLQMRKLKPTEVK